MLLNKFFGTTIFLIVVEVLRYFVRQFRKFPTNFLVESKFSFPTWELVFGGDGDGQKTPHGHPDFHSHV
jgi:hypothetical protein